MRIIISFFQRILGKIASFFKKLFLPRSWGKIYYINGATVLPTPLSREEEAELIERMREDESLKKVLVAKKRAVSTATVYYDSVAFGYDTVTFFS